MSERALPVRFEHPESNMSSQISKISSADCPIYFCVFILKVFKHDDPVRLATIC